MIGSDKRLLEMTERAKMVWYYRVFVAQISDIRSPGAYSKLPHIRTYFFKVWKSKHCDEKMES